MKKYVMEFVGTMFFVVSIITVLSSGSTLAPLVIGLALMALVYGGAAISGGHYNPAVTLGLWFRGKINTTDGVSYIVAQLIGAAAGFWATNYLLQVTYAPTMSPDMTAVFVSELLFTFALVHTVYQTAVRKSAAGNSYFGLAIGTVVLVGAAAVGGISGGYFNPAVLLGVALQGGLPTSGVITIVVAQLIGAFLASWFYAYSGDK